MGSYPLVCESVGHTSVVGDLSRILGGAVFELVRDFILPAPKHTVIRPLLRPEVGNDHLILLALSLQTLNLFS